MSCHQCRLLGQILLNIISETKSGFSPQAPAIGAAIKELIDVKRAANLRDDYIESLEHYLGRFEGGHQNVSVAELTHNAIETWVSQFESPSSRQTWLNRISTLFAFCKQRGYIKENPCDAVAKVKVDAKTPRILTPPECVACWESAPTLCRPYIVLALYCGIRPAEVTRLEWSDISLENRLVQISAAASKVRSRRMVDLPDIAIERLADHPIKKGPVTPSDSTLRRFKRKIRSIIGWWQADVFRHTCASYMLAHMGDAGKVALQLGNSPKILLTHYNGLATKEAAERFFSGK